MTSGTAVIKNSDMEIHMEKDVINLSSIAFQKFSVEKDIAAYIKKQLDKKYGYEHDLVWHNDIFLDQAGIALLEKALVHMLPIKHLISYTSTSINSPFFSSNQHEHEQPNWLYKIVHVYLGIRKWILEF